MADLVPADEIEQIVGARRHSIKHLGRLISEEQWVYILHSRMCLSTGRDLRECAFSVAMDALNDLEFVGYMDRPIVLAVSSEDELLPAEVAYIRENTSSWADNSEPIEYLSPALVPEPAPTRQDPPMTTSDLRPDARIIPNAEPDPRKAILLGRDPEEPDHE